ncbi:MULTISPECIES: PAS domain S-box protein [Haloarcula]|uniref:PAS domain S-box protein n=1 Tax=Haloarcula TaxID=2237 RepID=UPI0023EDAF5A|nr:PAS domain S-box protein [Halomicroarcula sp. XH51]
MSEADTEAPHSVESGVFSVGRQSPDVLYVQHGQERHTGVTSALTDEHGLTIHVVSSVHTGVDRLQSNSATFDCLVIDTGDESLERSLISKVQEQRPDLPLIVYAGAECGSAMCQEYLSAGASDVVSKATDTETGTLLANRIEHCVALDRERSRADQLRTTIDQMKHGVLIADPDGEIKYVNQAFETLGYSRKTLEESSLIELRSKAHDEQVCQEFWETLTAGNAWSGELTVSGGDGETYPVNLTATPVQDTDSEIRRIVAVGDEITNRKQYERQLEDTRQKYQALIDTAPDAIVVADAETGEIVETNETAVELFDRPRNELVGMDQTKLHPPEQRDRYRELFERHRRTGEAVFDQFDTGDPIYISTADGDRIPVEINAKVVELDGQTLVQGNFRDITERKERERRLRGFREAVEQAGHAIMITDTDGTIEYVNPAFKEVTGYSETEALGERPSILKSGEHNEEFYEDLWGMITSGDVWQGELINERKDGTRYIINQTISPVTNEDGEITGFIGINADITERKEREHELEILRTAIDHAEIPLSLTDPSQEGNPLVYVNDAFEKVTGYAEPEAIGRNCRFLQGDQTDPETVATLREAIDAEEEATVELRNYRKDGEMFWNRLTVCPIYDEDGNLIRYFGSQQDITEQKEFQEQLKRERDRLDEFAGTVAHDLRNPLTVALGHVDLAYQNQTTDDVATLLETAITALERMETVIDEVLTLSEQGETIQEPEAVHLGEVVDDAWGLTETSSATLSLTDDIDDGSVLADESRLCELFENLFRNAVEHAGPDVTVQVGTLAERDGFFIADDGPGLPPKDHNRIFESGYTTSDDGTGFGLAIVKQIVEAHGWEITVADATTETGGARFEIITET